MSAHDDDKFDDALPTTIDPGVPTGARARPEQFDPHARLRDNRAATPAGGRPVAADVIASLKPVRHDDPLPAKMRAASHFDPSGRIDDSSRTAKWAPRELDAREPRSHTDVPTRVEGPGRADDPARRVEGPGRAGDPARITEVPTRVEGLGRPDDPARRAKAPTRRGHDGAASAPPVPGARAAGPSVPSHAAGPSVPSHAAGSSSRTATPLPLPLAAPSPSVLMPAQSPVPPRDRSEPMRVISMKTPADLEQEKAQRVLPVVQLRAISDVHKTPARGMGNLAPPRDPLEVRSRRLRDNVIWGSLAVILASAITLAIWFLARR